MFKDDNKTLLSEVGNKPLSYTTSNYRAAKSAA